MEDLARLSGRKTRFRDVRCRMNTPRGTLVVVGAGGHAADVVDAARAAGWREITIYDDDPAKHGTTVLGASCLGPLAQITPERDKHFVVAIGRNEVRQKIAAALEGAGLHAVTIQHPSCIISPSASVARGAFLGALSWIGPNVTIGRHALINVGVAVAHGASLGDWAQLCPGARLSGGVNVGSGAFVGSNAVLAPEISIGAWSQIGACSFVREDVPANKLAVGTPAKIVSRS